MPIRPPGSPPAYLPGPPGPPRPYGDPFIPALSGILTSSADSVVTVLPSAGSPWAADDAVFINQAWQYATAVRLIQGLTYNTLTPVLPPPGCALIGSGVGSAQSVNGLAARTGAVIKPGPSWGSGGQPVSGAVTLLAGARQGIRGVDIDCSSAPPAVDGISLYGAVNATIIEHVGVSAATGKGIGLYQDASLNQPDGPQISDSVISSPAGDGISGITVDMTAVNTHVQGAGGRAWYMNGNNCRLIACRADLSAHGFVTDTFYPAATAPGATVLAGCGTQSNTGHGVWAANSSASGNVPRQPLIVTAGTFLEDGQDGASAALQASGVASLIVSDSLVLANTTGPVYGVGTEKLGGSGPPLVQVWGGFINALTACVHDVGPAQLLSYRFHGVQGGAWNGNATPAAPSLFTLNS